MRKHKDCCFESFCLSFKPSLFLYFSAFFAVRAFLHSHIYYTLTKALGKNIDPNFGPDRKGDIKHSNADISKAKEMLGYDPQYDFTKGLNEAIAWYKENL